MMLSRLKGAVVAAALLIAGPAFASTFSFTFTSVTNSGVVTGTASSNSTSSPFVLTGANGTINTSIGSTVITGLDTTTYNPDNTIYFGQPSFVSAAGVSFTTTSGFVVNISFANGQYLFRSGFINAPLETATVVRTDVVAVPGPLAGAGLIPLLGLAGAMVARRRREKLAA